MIIHCADTPNGYDGYRIEDIDLWHKMRGFARDPGWAANHQPLLGHVGYHRVIHMSGEIAQGRALVEVGAHCEGHNHRSIGICMIGRDAFSKAQWVSLSGLVFWLRRNLILPTIVGHRDYDASRTCPGFDVTTWMHGGMEPLDGHIVPQEKIVWKK